jgi:hypothetical protein
VLEAPDAPLPCLTGLLEVVERNWCSIDVLVRVVGIVDRASIDNRLKHRVVVLVEEAVVLVEDVVAQFQKVVGRSTE